MAVIGSNSSTLIDLAKVSIQTADSSVSPSALHRARTCRAAQCGLDRLGQQIGVQGFSFQQHRQIEVVLQAAVGHAQQGDGVEFFRDDRVRRAGRPGRGQIVQQDRIDRIHRRRCDGIAEADIDLRLAARLGQFARDDHADAAVAGFLADFLDRDRCGVECNAVVNSHGGDVAKVSATDARSLAPKPSRSASRVARWGMSYQSVNSSAPLSRKRSACCDWVMR